MARDDCYAICPHCGHKHGDCWEWVKDTPRDHRCDGCDQLFSVYAEYSVDYITSVKLVEPAEAGDTKSDAPRIAADGAPVWPSGCRKPGSCERHRSCVYTPCVHKDRDIQGEIDLAVAAKRAEASGTKREGEGE